PPATRSTRRWASPAPCCSAPRSSTAPCACAARSTPPPTAPATNRSSWRCAGWRRCSRCRRTHRRRPPRPARWCCRGAAPRRSPVPDVLRPFLLALVLLDLAFVQITAAVDDRWLAGLWCATAAAPLLVRFCERLVYRVVWNGAVLAAFAFLMQH